ncbi:MAG: hypothetical protein K2N51_05185 [Lachnospiraceae bacterium]|nr:hypothetical protein [Lachnospiraceae bacterium]
MGNTRVRKRRVAFLMCAVMFVCSICIMPKNTKKVNAAEKFTSPVTEYATEENSTTWKVLWVIPLVTTAENGAQKGSKVSDLQLHNLQNYIIPNFEDYIYEYSMHYMKIDSTVITVPSVEADSNEAYGHLVQCDKLQKAIEGSGRNILKGNFQSLTEYDQITCAWRPTNKEDASQTVGTLGFAGLGGPRFDGLKAGFNQIPLFSDTLDITEGETWKDSNGNLTKHFYYCDLFVHEFMHNLEFWVSGEYPGGVRREMPSPDGCWDYYTPREGFDLMNDFYKNFFRGNVPVSINSTKTFGMTPADYANHPAKYSVGTPLGTVSVGSAAELKQVLFDASMLNTDTDTSITITANIDMKGEELVCIKNFGGTINGNGHCIANAKITNSHGFVETLREGGVIKDLHFVNVKVNNQGIGAFTGTIVASNYGKISSCSVSGSVYNADWQTGGICGENYGTGIISNCSNSANVHGTAHYVGGIAASSEGKIDHCLNSGKISGGGDNVASVTNILGGTCEKIYTLDIVASGNVGETKTAEELLSDDFLDLLNDGGSIWKKGKSYPVHANIKFDPSEYEIIDDAKYILYANGGTVKQADNTKINYKLKTYPTDLVASDIVVTDKKGNTKIKKGKLIAGVTLSDSMPDISKGKFPVDKEAKKIATVSISKGNVKITAKNQPGEVYLWVMDTGDERAYTCEKVSVKPAPSKMQIFAKSSDAKDFSSDNKSVYKKDTIGLGNEIKLYLYPTYKLNKTMQKTEDATYSISVDNKAKDYFVVKQSVDDPYCFSVKATSLKNNKKTTGKITIKCNENGKKAVFSATAVNCVQGITLESFSGLTEKTGAEVSTLSIEKSDTTKVMGSFQIAISKNSDDFETTDKAKLYAMGDAQGFDKAKMDAGKVKITSNPDKNQKKISVKLDKDKKTVKVTAAKGVPAGTTGYYLIVYNTVEGKGYKVVKIIATEKTE